MVLEVALLDIKTGMEKDFERSFKDAQLIISSMKGYLSHQLQKCIEKPNRYILLVNWASLDDHTIGFRGSPEYQQWKGLLHHYYDPLPSVEHFETIDT